MNKLIITLVLCVCMITTSTFGQEKKDRVDFEQRMDQRMEKLEKELALTPEQVAKIKAVNMETHQQQIKLKQEMQEVKLAKKEAYKTILTEEQQTKMEELRSAKKSETKRHCSESKGQQKHHHKKKK